MPRHLLLALLLATGAVQAQEADDPLSDLLDALQEETEEATSSRLNIDFVPGMMTVLHGDELLAMGLSTVYEALSLVPGAQTAITNFGQPQVIFRGAGRNFASSNAKLMLDGQSLNSALNGQSTLLSLPLELVDRIEVIRGPGASVYGEFAFAGVINVITREDGSRAFGRYAKDGRKGVGAMAHFGVPGGARLGLTAALADNPGGQVQAGLDRLQGQNGSNAPGPSNERSNQQTFMAELQVGRTQLHLRHLRTGLGDHFGINDILPPPEQRITRTLTDQIVALEQNLDQGENRFNVVFAWSRFGLHSDRITILPAGYTVIDPGTGQPITDPDTGLPVTYPDGAWGSPHHAEERWSNRLQWSRPWGRNHHILGGVELSLVSQTDAWVERNYDPNSIAAGPFAPQRFTGDQNWIKEGLKRQMHSAYLQDDWNWRDRFMLTLGLRMDHYNDVGMHLSPRIATVWRAAEHHTVKFQWTDAFRPPTFVELYSQNNAVVVGQPNLHPERIRSLEASYAFNDGRSRLRATAFHVRLDSLIGADQSTTPARYRNLYISEFNGVEIDLESHLHPRLTAFANATLLLAEQDSDEYDPFYGLAEHLGNAGLRLRLTPGTTLATLYQDVGDRSRAPDDDRAPLPGYHTIDVTLSAHLPLPYPTVVRGTVRNLLREDIRYPAPAGTYPDDYPRPGRSFWVSFAVDF